MQLRAFCIACICLIIVLQIMPFPVFISVVTAGVVSVKMLAFD